MVRGKGIHNEDSFQAWVVQRFKALIPGAHVLDLSAVGGDIPDLNIAHCDKDAEEAGGGYEFWLELKFDWFRLGHDRYDPFGWSKMKRGQLEFLRRREHTRTAICGVLGYARTHGGDRKAAIGADYLVFHTAQQYLSDVWMREPNCGGVFLSGHAVPAHSIKTGRDLIDFVSVASLLPLHNVG